MKKQGKILLTDIKAGRNQEESIKKYLEVLGTAFSKYATIKLSLNYFTMVEMTEGMKEKREAEISEYFLKLKKAIKDTAFAGKNVEASDLADIVSIRDAITEKMKVLTAYTDALEIYEYILNRKEAEVKGEIDEFIDTDYLADEMFNYVFADNDKMVINSKIQSCIAQLPVRITKNRFFDIISNTLVIYKGGEKEAVDDFVSMIENTVLINKPQSFETEYKELFNIYKTLRDTDYKVITVEDYARLIGLIEAASEIIGEAVTDYMMMQEIINDALIILYTANLVNSEYLDDKYEAAKQILNGVMGADDIYSASEGFDECFVKLEGAQEEAYEELSWLEGNLMNLTDTYYEMSDADTKDMFDKVGKADRLTSSSLFMDIDTGMSIISDSADDAYIQKKKEKLIDEFSELFKEMPNYVKRSIMAKTLAVMPVFFNSQQEIKDYFRYALSRCGDDSELTACRNIMEDMIAE